MNFAYFLGKVAVLMGGKSGEREVSLLSGNAVLSALKNAGVDAHAFDPASDSFEKLRGFDRAFIALHGAWGENGGVQGVLEYFHVPYTGSGVLASALGMDKWRSKLIWEAYGLPVPKSVLLTDDFEKNIALTVENLGFPVFVKPANEGSSLGITRVDKKEDLNAAYKTARALDSMVLAEKAMLGGEYTVGILNGKALPIIEIRPNSLFYDYEAKYLRDDTQYLCPAPKLSESQTKQIQEESLIAFNALNAKGWGRIDFLMDNEAKHYFLEINTAPGMTSHSLVPMAAKAAGLDFQALVLKILESAALEGSA